MSHYQEVVSFYKRRYSTFGNSPRSLGWGSPIEQRKRFEALIRDYDPDLLASESIVDFGCGLAHFLPWLQERGYGKFYTGVDIVEDFLAENRLRFPGYEFLKSEDFLNNGKRYGFIFASGVFTIPWGDNHPGIVKGTIEKLFDKCIYGFSFNMLYGWSLFKNPRFYYFNPRTVDRFCGTLTSKRVLDCSYLPGDFTIRMWK
ncbi:MAG: class I SAM-dependent methyltransferase [Bacillota bacterium]